MHATISTVGARPRTLRWRVVDIVVASVVAVASGVVFWVWGVVQNPISGPAGALLPGFQGILNGPWLFA
ncbi:ECF transporter S component, partial [Bacillus sp. SIMBA_074]